VLWCVLSAPCRQKQRCHFAACLRGNFKTLKKQQVPGPVLLYQPVPFHCVPSPSSQSPGEANWVSIPSCVHQKKWTNSHPDRRTFLGRSQSLESREGSRILLLCCLHLSSFLCAPGSPESAKGGDTKKCPLVFSNSPMCCG
jgi:hypothetical protein